MTTLIILGLLVAIVYLPRYLVVGAGYLVQKFKFGHSFKEVRAWHKEQDALERKNK